MTDGASLRVTQVIRAAPAEVFQAWTDPTHLRAWFCPAWATVVSATVDLRVGGRYRIVISREGALHTATGVYREITPPRRLVFTWDWEEEGEAMGETVVTVELRPHDAGTEVVLTHERLPEPRVPRHAQAWASCLEHLASHLAP